MAKAVKKKLVTYKVRVAMNFHYNVEVPFKKRERDMVVTALEKGGLRMGDLCAFGFRPLLDPVVKSIRMVLQKKGDPTKFSIKLHPRKKEKIKS